MALNVFIWSKGAVLSPYSGPAELWAHLCISCTCSYQRARRLLDCSASDQCHLHYTHPVNSTRSCFRGSKLNHDEKCSLSVTNVLRETQRADVFFKALRFIFFKISSINTNVLFVKGASLSFSVSLQII